MPTNVYGSLVNRMDYLVQRQGVVSGNIANSTTPGYITKDVTFESLVDKNKSNMSMSVTNGTHIKGAPTTSGGFAMTEDRTHIRHDGNSVKMDEEMLKLQETQMNYRLATKLYSKSKSMQLLALGKQG